MLAGLTDTRAGRQFDQTLTRAGEDVETSCAASSFVLGAALSTAASPTATSRLAARRSRLYRRHGHRHLRQGKAAADPSRPRQPRDLHRRRRERHTGRRNNGTFDLLVNFEFNSDQLTPAAKENLDQFAKALQDPRLKGQKFEIDGHTDATGTEDYNLGLSERRANAVVAYLASQGIDATALIAKGFGKTKPRVADPFSAENRRVETHLIE